MQRPEELLRIELARWKGKFPDVQHLDAVELREMLAQGQRLQLVDVRSEGEYRVSSLPGAIPVAEFKGPVEGVPTVVFCTVGYRSALHTRKLAEQFPESAGIRL